MDKFWYRGLKGRCFNLGDEKLKPMGLRSSVAVDLISGLS